MDNIYTTTQGDTWDIISLKVYGTDQLAHKIIDSNEHLCKTVFFASGIKLIIPDIEIETNKDLPPWRN